MTLYELAAPSPERRAPGRSVPRAALSSDSQVAWSGEAPVACWFGPAERPLLGFVHGAAPGRAAPGVVLCPPLARELQSAHYGFRRLADALATKGLVVVRFDYDGTGDSAGDDEDPDRVAAWLSSIELAAGLAREHGATSISLVGLRMGGLLAELAARRLGDVEALVLWDPCVSGRAFVRQQRVLQLLETSDSPGAHPSCNELLGFPLEMASLRALADLTVPPPTGAVARRCLLLHRRKDPSLDALVARLGGTVTRRLVRNEDQLDVEPLVTKVPEATIADLAEWLVETLRPLPPVPAPTPRAAPVLRDLPARATVVADSAHGPVSERVLRTSRTGLLGIETAPARLDPTRPAVLLLTTAADHRIGPNRFWVHLAREWASLGFRSVRFDVSGMGDSPTRPGQRPQVMRGIAAFDDVLEMAEAASPADPSNVVLVGLCSGAYQALESALELAPRGVLALNPALVFLPPEVVDGDPVDRRRRVGRCTPASIRSIRRIVPDALRQRLPRPLRRRVVPALSRVTRPRGGAAGRTWLGGLVELGVDTYFVCGDEETRELREELGPARAPLEASGLVTIEAVSGLNHALIPAGQRRHVATLLSQRLLERFATPDAGGVTRAG